jgi:hypothetical protein
VKSTVQVKKFEVRESKGVDQNHTRSVTLLVDRVYREFREVSDWKVCVKKSRDREARSSEEFRRSRGPQEW